MTTVIVDTNVILVANGQHEAVGEECVVSCTTRLQRLMDEGRLAIDDGYLILEEYLQKTRPQAGTRPGDAFVKWLLRNNFNAARCDLVPLRESAQRGFESFPDDERLSHFDRSDRKFVAVAVAHPEHPPIYQATDSKWLGWAPALRDHGVVVEFLCPDDITSFDGAKKARKEGVI